MSSARSIATGPLNLSWPAIRSWMSALAGTLPRNPEVEALSTVASLPTSAEETCRQIMLYEEVPGRPSLLLRLFLPLPIRSEGRKSQPGDIVRCIYQNGHIVKRTTIFEEGRLFAFEVLEQRLGIEGFATLGEGSYQIFQKGSGSQVLLTTCYRGHLRPRWLWRPLERWLVHGVHLRILDGMRCSAAASVPRALPQAARAVSSQGG